MKSTTILILLSAVIFMGGCKSENELPPAEVVGNTGGSPLLYVWAGDQDKRPNDTDFLAVLDSNPDSPTYGEVLATEPVGDVGTNPHHAEPVAPRGALLFANGYDSGRTFLFDLSVAGAPELQGELDTIEGFAYPHSFLRLEDGTLLATLQYGDGSTPENPGGLARFGPQAELIGVASAADPAFESEIIRPYAVEAVPEMDRIITTGRTMNFDAEQAADLVQIWSLSDLRLLKTMRVPRVEPVTAPECVLGVGDICDASQYPAEAHHSRVARCGMVRCS